MVPCDLFIVLFVMDMTVLVLSSLVGVSKGVLFYLLESIESNTSMDKRVGQQIILINFFKDLCPARNANVFLHI